MKKVRIYIFLYSLFSFLILSAEENPKLNYVPQFYDFGSVLPGNTNTVDIILKTSGQDILIKRTGINSSVFKIIEGNIITPTILRNNDSILIKIEFAPTDSNLIYGEIFIETDSIFTNKITLKGGFPYLTPKLKSLMITNPVCNETILFGDSINIEWKGVLPSDTVKLEYSIDNGYSWNIIVNRVGALSYNWSPDFQTNGCQIKATQFWPDYSSGDIIFRHNSEVNSANFSSDGNLVITSTRDGKATMFDARSGNKIREFDSHLASVRWAVFSPDTHYIATASDDSTAILWETNTGKLVRVMKGHGDAVRCVNFSSDSKKLVTASLDGYAYVWDVETGTVLNRIYAGQFDMLWYAEFHPTNNLVMTAGTEGTIKLWSFNPLKLFKKIDTLNSLIPFATFSKSGNYIGGASWSGPAYIWDITGKRISYVIHSDSVIGVVPINSVSFNYNEDSIITAGTGDFLAKIWNINTGEPGQVLRGHKSAVQTAFFSNDGSRVLTSSWDSTARIWNLYTKVLQSDTIDCAFKISKPTVDVKDLDFGRVALGDSKDSVVNSILLNKSGFSFNIKNIILSGKNPSDFSIKDFQSSAYLDTDSTIGYEITFQPSDTGLRNAVIEFYIGKDTLKSNLIGYGVLPPIQKVVNEIDFGNVNIGGYKDTTITALIKNSGTAEVDISFKLSGNDCSYFQILSQTDSIPLKPDSSLSITIKFSPDSISMYNCIMSVSYNLQIVPCIIDIIGNGVKPWNDTISIRLPYIKYGIGNLISIPILIDGIIKNDFNEMIDTIFSEISFNSTLLEYLGSAQYSIENNSGKLKLIMPTKNLSDSILYELNFRTGLGNDSISVLKFDSVSYSGKGVLLINSIDGLFILDGICRENEPRLFIQDGIISLSQNKPNPVENITKIEFNVAESGLTKIFVVDLLGNIVKTVLESELKPGYYEIEIDVTNLTAGQYYYILQTPTIKITRQMNIYK